MPKKNPKILFIHNTLPNYRVGPFTKLSKELEIKFVFTDLESAKKIYKDKINSEILKNINHISLKKRGISWGLISLLLKKDYDLIILSSPDKIIPKIETFLSIVIVKGIKNKKIILWNETWENKTNSKLKKLLRDLSNLIIIRFVDSSICVGTKSKEYLMKLGMNQEKIYIAPDISVVEPTVENINKDELNRIRMKYNIPQDKIIILYLGRIIKRKGLDYLIYAFKKLESERDDVYLLVVGDGDFKPFCMDLTKKLKIKNINFVGYVPHNEKPYFYYMSKIFVIPSINHETWGLVLNEAMEYENACIATNAVGGAYDLIINGYNGYIVPEKDSDAIYMALNKILSDRNTLKNMARHSKRIIQERFSYARWIEGFKNAIHNTLTYENIK